MSDLIFKVSNEENIERQDIVGWFDNISNNIESIVYDANHIDIDDIDIRTLSLDIYKLSDDLKSTIDLIKMAELTRSEINTDLQTMKYATMDEMVDFKYNDAHKYLSEMVARIDDFILDSQEALANGTGVDFSKLNEMLNNDEIGASNQFNRDFRLGFEQNLINDFKQIDNYRELILLDHKSLNISDRDLPSIAKNSINVDRIDRLHKSEIENLEESGILPIGKPLFNADKLHTEDLKSGSSIEKSDLKRNFRLSLNNEAMREWWIKFGREFVYGTPFSKAWDNLKDIFKSIRSSGKSVSVAYSEVDSKSSAFKILTDKEIITLTDSEFKDIRGLTSSQQEIMRDIRKKSMLRIDSKSESIDTLLNKEIRASKTIVSDYLDRRGYYEVLSSDEIKNLKVNVMFIDKANELKRKGNVEPNDLEILKIKQDIFKKVRSDELLDEKEVDSVRSKKQKNKNINKPY